MGKCQWKESWSKGFKFVKQWYVFFIKAHMDVGSAEKWTWTVHTYCRIIGVSREGEAGWHIVVK